MMARSTARRAQAPHFEVNIFTGDAHRLSPKFVDNVLVVSGAAPLAEYVNRVGRGVTPVSGQVAAAGAPEVLQMLAQMAGRAVLTAAVE